MSCATDRRKKCAPFHWRPAEFEFPDHLFGDLPFGQVRAGRGAGLREKQFVINVRGDLADLVEFFLLPAVVFMEAPFGKRDMRALREGLERLGERHILVTHEKTEHIAAGPASETVEHLLFGLDHERGGFFLMERTTGLEMPAGTLQRNVLRNDLDDIVGRSDLFDDMVFIARPGAFFFHNASFFYPPALTDPAILRETGL